MKGKIPYYWESALGHGSFTANNDREALELKPSHTIILYKENDSEDGTPFIVLYEKKKREKGN